MHCEAENCDLSLENVANGFPFVSSTAAAQTRWDRLFRKRLMVHHVPVQKILSSLRMARATRSKTFLSTVGKDRRSYPFQNHRQLFELLVAFRVEKHETSYVQKKKNYHPFELVQATKLNVFSSATSFKLIFKPRFVGIEL